MRNFDFDNDPPDTVYVCADTVLVTLLNIDDKRYYFSDGYERRDTGRIIGAGHEPSRYSIVKIRYLDSFTVISNYMI